MCFEEVATLYRMLRIRSDYLNLSHFTVGAINENTHVFMFIFFQESFNKYLLSDYFLWSTIPSDEDVATNKKKANIFCYIEDISMEEKYIYTR